MERQQVKRLPVIDDKTLVGMISERDIAQHLNEHRIAEFAERVYATA